MRKQEHHTNRTIALNKSPSNFFCYPNLETLHVTQCVISVYEIQWGKNTFSKGELLQSQNAVSNYPFMAQTL
uniref:Uncharacterized protein n=1 Tax=Anguilla anguilla TaxID=7936 RepID=A0A0E9X548_ANGAN